MSVVGLTKAAALDYAPSNIRTNAVCQGIVDTPIMDRFSGGTDEGRQALIAQEPVGTPPGVKHWHGATTNTSMTPKLCAHFGVSWSCRLISAPYRLCWFGS